jgi:GWxTD domain-containing protein
MRKAQRAFAAIGISAFVITNSLSQGMRRPGPLTDRGLPVAFTRAVAVADTAASSGIRVDVWYRIDREFFIKARPNEESLTSPLIRHGDVTVELADSLAGVRLHAHEAFKREEPDADRRGGPRAWQEGVISLTPPPGTYTVTTTFEDLESRRTLTERARPQIVKPKETAGISEGALIPVQRPDDLVPAFLTPVNFGENLPFGGHASFLWAWNPRSSADTVLHVTARFSEVPPAAADSGAIIAPVDTLVRAIRSTGLTPVRNHGAVGYALNQSDTGRVFVALVPFPSESLLLRTYAVSVHGEVQGDSATLAFRARMEWPDMPFSLRDVDNALDALRYITSAKELDSLRTGSAEVRRNNLESFWKRRAPDPTLAYNPVEAEYYRRVDHAIREFGTVRNPDGFRTDRGKIYVLYGPPSGIDRSLDPDGDYREIWTYDRTKRVFTFVDRTKTGAYVLQSSTP